jgi:hypothetical protein
MCRIVSLQVSQGGALLHQMFITLEGETIWFYLLKYVFIVFDTSQAKKKVHFS